MKKKTVHPWWRWIEKKLIGLNDTPERIAIGVAVGVFIGIAPTFGLGTLLAAGLAAIFHFNMAAAIVGTMAGMPLLAPFIWIASSWLGGALLGYDWNSLYREVSDGNIFDSGGQIIFAYLLGNAILTAVLTALSWYLTLRAVRSYRHSRSRLKKALTRPRKLPIPRVHPFRRGGGRRR